MKKLLIAMFLIAPLMVNAQDPDGKIRQGNGVARPTAEIATMDLIGVCLGMPLIQAGAVTFDGIEDLTFTKMADGSTFAYVKCVYKPVSK